MTVTSPAYNYVVVRDTREKDEHGWVFSAYGNCRGTQFNKLDTGDYSILGMESIVCIERKGSISEFAQNILQDRFEREMERMRSFKYAFILLEFDMDTLIGFPASIKLPKYLQGKIKISGRFILRRMLEIEIKYGVHFILCGQNGKDVASQLFKLIMEDAKNSKQPQS